MSGLAVSVAVHELVSLLLLSLGAHREQLALHALFLLMSGGALVGLLVLRWRETPPAYGRWSLWAVLGAGSLAGGILEPSLTWNRFAQPELWGVLAGLHLVGLASLLGLAWVAIRDGACPRDAEGDPIDLCASHHRYRLLFVGMFLWIGVGLLGVQRFGQLEEARARQSLGQRAQTAAAAFSVAEIRAIARRVDAPMMARVKEQLQRIKRLNPDCRSTYIMGQSGTGVCFLLDSEPKDSPIYSPPGCLYPECSSALRATFHHGRALVEGPYADSYGTWVSGIAPVGDDLPVPGVFGMDVDVNDWHRGVARYRLLGMALVLAITLIGAVAVIAGTRLRRTALRLAASEARLSLINDTFLQFSSDPLANINRLTALGGHLLHADCALYNRLLGDELHSWGQWQTPPDYRPVDKAMGHICYDVVCQGSEEPVHIRHLPATAYYTTDPNVRPYGLQTYVGIAVQTAGHALGSLGVVFGRDVIPTGEDCKVLTILASAIGVEELRKQVQDSERWHVALLEAMVTASPFGLLVVDNRTDAILYTNPRFCRIWELEAQEAAIRAGELTNTGIIPFCIPLLADVAAFAASCTPLQDVDNRAIVEDEIPFLDGRIIRRFSTQIRDADDGYQGRFYLFEDVTARKQEEQALQYREALEQVIVELSAQFMACGSSLAEVRINYALRRIGEFEEVDRAYVFLFSADQETMDNTHEWCAPGISPERDNLQNLPTSLFPWWVERLNRFETLHIPVVAALPPAADAERTLLQAQAIQSVLVLPLRYGDTLLGFIGFDSVRGAKRWHDDAQALLRVVGEMVVNALVRQHSEREIAQLHQNLEWRLQKMHAANRELEAFSYSVSHDLQAPVRRLTGFSQALLEDYHERLDTTGRDYLTFIHDSTLQLTTLIDALLGLSRISRSELRWEDVDISALAQEVLADLARREDGRTVQTTVAPGLTVFGDQSLLRVALENLLNNAWKFTRTTEQARIDVGSVREGERLVYFVRDNGAGFDMTYADRLFGAFQRLHSTEEFDGTGIGLATVQRILHRHGGRIWADGAIGAGATFFFTLAAEERTIG